MSIKVRVRAVEEEATEVIAQEMFTMYHLPVFREEIAFVPRWHRASHMEKERWRRAARRLQDMLLTGDIEVERG